MSSILEVERPFYVIRHGQTCHNASRVVSAPHVLLSMDGENQAKALAPTYHAVLARGGAHRVIASGLPRAQRTAELMTGSKPQHIEPGLNERSSGFLAGAMRLVDLEVWMSGTKEGANEFLYQTNGAQTEEVYAEQVVSALNKQLKGCPAEETPIFVAHHGTIEQAVKAAGHLEHYHFNNATMYHFVPDLAAHTWSITEVSLQEGILHETPISPMIAGRWAQPTNNSVMRRTL